MDHHDNLFWMIQELIFSIGEQASEEFLKGNNKIKIVLDYKEIFEEAIRELKRRGEPFQNPQPSADYLVGQAGPKGEEGVRIDVTDEFLQALLDHEDYP